MKKLINDSTEDGGDGLTSPPAKPWGRLLQLWLLPCEMRNRCGKDLMKNGKRPGDRGESQRAAAGRTENWGGRGTAGKKQWPVASPTAPSAERRLLCNALSVWVSKRWTILPQRARAAHKTFFFSPPPLDVFLSPRLRAPAGRQMYLLIARNALKHLKRNENRGEKERKKRNDNKRLKHF